jgi:hypothetical protein
MGENPYRWRWLALVAILVAEVMDLLDATIVGVAAPTIQRVRAGQNEVRASQSVRTFASPTTCSRGSSVGRRPSIIG